MAQPEQQAREEIDRLLSMARDDEIETDLNRTQMLRQALLGNAFTPAD